METLNFNRPRPSKYRRGDLVRGFRLYWYCGTNRNLGDTVLDGKWTCKEDGLGDAWTKPHHISFKKGVIYWASWQSIAAYTGWKGGWKYGG